MYISRDGIMKSLWFKADEIILIRNQELLPCISHSDGYVAPFQSYPLFSNTNTGQ